MKIVTYKCDLCKGVTSAPIGLKLAYSSGVERVEDPTQTDIHICQSCANVIHKMIEGLKK